MSDHSAERPALITARVSVRFRDGLEVPWSSDDLDGWLDGVTGQQWSALRQQVPGLTARPVFADPRPIERISARARKLAPGTTTPRWRSFGFLDTDRPEDLGVVRDAVRDWGAFTSVRIHGPFGAPAAPVLPADDTRFEEQLHHRGEIADFGDGQAGKQGHGVSSRYAWRFPGGDGNEVAFADVEAGWGRNHPDLPASADLPIVFGEQEPSWKLHGTQMLGVVCALDSEEGVVGIAPGAGPFTLASISQLIPDNPAKDLPSGPAAGLSEGHRANVPAAIAKAAAELGPGDVLLIEVEMPGDAAGIPALPVEADPDTFDVIQDVVQSGIVVVEAAGNGGGDIDAVVGHPAKDSGAILVGAALGYEPHDPMKAGNHGARIDCWGWGTRVLTTWWGGGGSFDYECADGTSSAAAMVAGVCLSVQGMHKAHTGASLSPSGLRDLLRDPTAGTPTSDHTLGVLPDLRKIADEHLRLPYPYVREDLGDGGEPFPPTWGASPDIIVANAPPADPDAAFADVTERWPGDIPALDVPNSVYVRVRNRGKSDAKDVRVLLFESVPATFATPAGARVIDEVTVPHLPAGAFVISPAMSWTPTSRFAALGTIIGIGGEPPYLPDFAGYLRHGGWLRHESRAVATRMLFRVPWDARPGPHTARSVMLLPFRAGGNTGAEREYRLEVDLTELAGRDVALIAPAGMLAQMARGDGDLEALPVPFGARLRLPAGERVGLAAWVSPPDDFPELQIEIDGEAELGADCVTLTVTQRAIDDTEIGSVTWRLEALRPDDVPNDAEPA